MIKQMSRPRPLSPDAVSPSLTAGAIVAWKSGAKSLSSTQTTKRLAWIDQLSAVRDHQDRAAFAELFEYFAPRIKSFLMKSGTLPDMAEECAQEVMVTVWNKAHLFDPAKASVSTWIFTIARNRRIDMIRKNRRPEPEDLPWGPEETPSQADTLALQEETEMLGRALADLPEKQRQLIERAYFGELTHSEIAAETGLPLGTIKSRIRLALDRLRHAMN
ncbi:MAG: sigma-70 family RNA polymerase sigma factor [Yoonia sp.]|nr:sigma-70 family RNA polymerase sigma factor [Yoonia sp.]